MSEQIDRIVWFEKRQRMEVIYAGRGPDHVVANVSVAEVLAQDAGLVLVSAPPGIVQWIRHPKAQAFA